MHLWEIRDEGVPGIQGCWPVLPGCANTRVRSRIAFLLQRGGQLCRAFRDRSLRGDHEPFRPLASTISSFPYSGLTSLLVRQRWQVLQLVMSCTVRTWYLSFK